MTNKKYLSFEGLEKYDKLIKSYIAKSNKSLSDDVDMLKDDVSVLKAIDHEAYISADASLEESLKTYIEDAVVAVSEEDIDNLFKE